MAKVTAARRVEIAATFAIGTDEVAAFRAIGEAVEAASAALKAKGATEIVVDMKRKKVDAPKDAGTP